MDRGGQAVLPSIQDFLDDLPPIEDFVDSTSGELRPIEDFVADDKIESVAEPANSAGTDWFEQGGYDADGWAVSGWQSFDWSGAAALGVRDDSPDDFAANGWDTLDWSAAPPLQPPRNQSGNVPPSADEVARALDGIARRIRSGELVIDQLSGAPPEAAMAAALAAFLRMRD